MSQPHSFEACRGEQTVASHLEESSGEIASEVLTDYQGLSAEVRSTAAQLSGMALVRYLIEQTRAVSAPSEGDRVAQPIPTESTVSLGTEKDADTVFSAESAPIYKSPEQSSLFAGGITFVPQYRNRLVKEPVRVTLLAPRRFADRRRRVRRDDSISSK